MIVGSILENQNFEKRISIVPEIIKKYNSLNCEVHLSKDYGKHLGIEDHEYEKAGAKIIGDNKKLIENSDLIVQMGLLNSDYFSILKSNQTVIGVLDSYNNKEQLLELSKKKN